MINPNTGQILLPSNGICVGPSLSREEFLASPMASHCHVSVRNEPYCTFKLPTVQIDGHSYAWGLSFHGSALERVSIQCADTEFGLSWSDWSEEKELARKRFHESLLQLIPGNDWNRRNFPWGSVDSGFDSKGGASNIVIAYKVK